MSKPYCEICECRIPSVSLVKGHEEGKKHLKWKTLRETQENTQACSVFVREFPKTEDVDSALLSYFSDFGDVKDIYIDKEKCKFACVEFTSKEVAQKLLSKSKEELPLYKDHRLTIKPRVMKELAHKTSKPRRDHSKKGAVGQVFDVLVSDALKEKLESSANVNDQLLNISTDVGTSTTEKELCSLVCKLLEEILVELHADAKVVPFGSSVNELGLLGCDLDVTLLTDELPMNPNSCHPDNSQATKPQQEKDDDLSQVEKALNFISASVSRCVPGIRVLKCITHAHCPVLKLLHKDSNVIIDMSINNTLGIQNTELLKAYADCYPPLIPLVRLLRLWSKARLLSGYGHGALSNYALTLMVIHYLQHCQDAKLPVLQHRSVEKDNRQNEDKIQGWDCEFSSKSKIVEDCIDYAQLLIGFYDYFLLFDFESNIVSIRQEGVMTIKQAEEELVSTCHLGPSDMKKFLSTMIVQDPFELSHNVTGNVASAAMDTFRLEWLSARDILEKACLQKQGSILEWFHVRSSGEKRKHIDQEFVFPKQQDTETESNYLDSMIRILEGHFKMHCQRLTSTGVADEKHSQSFEDTSEDSECPPKKKQRRDDTNSQEASLRVTAYQNTWTKQRQARRHQQKATDESKANTKTEEDSMEHDSAADSQSKSANKKPLITVIVSIDSSAKVTLKLKYAQTLDVFHSFYAIFKKMCLSEYIKDSPTKTTEESPTIES